MNILRFALTVLIVCLLSTGRANAVQINLSGENIEQYFRILEVYVLPFLVVSTIVLLCGYIASKVYHRRLNQSVEDLEEAQRSPTQRDEGTAAFLRELKTTPPIKDPLPDREPRLRLRLRRSKKKSASVDPIPPVAAEDRPTLDPTPDRFDDNAREPLLLRVPSDTPTVAAEPGLNATEDDRRVGSPEASHEHAPPIAPVPALTVDSLPLRVDTPETPASDDGPDEETPVSVEPGDAPDLETSFDLKAGYDSTLASNPLDTHALPEETPDPVGKTPEYAPPAPDLPLDLKLNGSVGDSAIEEPDPADDIPPPALDRTAWWADSSGSPDRIEPSPGVVQPLKPVVEAPSRDTRNAEKAATEIVRSLDRITSSLQQSMTALTDHIRHRRGLLLEDVQGLRISGFSVGVDIAERLRALDQQAVTDVHASYAAVDGLNRIVDRLEQMAADEALDEGWNDLIRTRLSETIYAVGQGKKTLLPHLPADPPETSDTRPDKRADDAGHAPHSSGVPFGTRQG